MPEKISQLLPVLGAIVAFLCAALLLLYIFRLLFGRRIRSPGARGRPRRLDIVDVFDLDRERQLVIVRRDNTEHLLLIGGPNDLLVEGTIHRVEGAIGRPVERQSPATGRATQMEAEPPSAPPGPGAPIKPATPVNLPPDLFAPAPTKPAAPPPPAASAPAPLPPLPPIAARTASPPPPISPAPPPRPAPPRTAPPFLARAQQRLGGGAPDDQPPPAAAAPPPPAAPKPPAPPPVAPKPAPPPAAPPPPPPAAATPPAAPAQPAAAAPAKDGDPLDSLEAEMARLLGRPDQK